MSTALVLDQALAYVRSQFTRAEVAMVAPYGGEFSGADVGQLSYTCPAILITVLGSKTAKESKRLVGKHLREVRLAAFVATKHAKREERMRQAMVLADRLVIALRAWAPDTTGQALALAPLEDEPRTENLYGRAIDQAGQALWLVDWVQVTQPLVAPTQLVDLLRVDITEGVREGTVPSSPTTPTTPLIVTDDVGFAALPPNP